MVIASADGSTPAQIHGHGIVDLSVITIPEKALARLSYREMSRSALLPLPFFSRLMGCVNVLKSEFVGHVRVMFATEHIESIRCAMQSNPVTAWGVTFKALPDDGENTEHGNAAPKSRPPVVPGHIGNASDVKETVPKLAHDTTS